jgi:beta-N-acetylglucosaminidase
MVKKSQKYIVNEKMLTKHFIRRYIERINSNRYSEKKDIVEALNIKMSDREKVVFKFFKNSKSVKLPFNKLNQMVVSRGRLITIY